MPRQPWLVVVLAFVIATLTACAGLASASTLPVGEEAPNFGIKLGHTTVALHDYRGRVTIVCFWRST